MRRVIDWLILLAVLCAALFLGYTHQPQVQSAIRFVRSGGVLCALTRTYSIGAIDPSFGISKDELEADLYQAEVMWEAQGKNFFHYQPSGGEITVNLIYDTRQATTVKLQAAGTVLDQSKDGYQVLKARYETLSARIASERGDYMSRARAYENDQAAYNTEVAAWNAKGGAPQSVFQKLQTQKSDLQGELANLKSLEASLNADVAAANSLATTLNMQIKQFNLNVQQYNQIGQAQGEFEEGLYQYENGVETIDIFEYASRVQLVRVLAHEMGHALGLDHVNDPSAIMYPINSGTSLKLAPDDIAELASVCGFSVAR